MPKGLPKTHKAHPHKLMLRLQRICNLVDKETGICNRLPLPTTTKGLTMTATTPNPDNREIPHPLPPTTKGLTKPTITPNPDIKEILLPLPLKPSTRSNSSRPTRHG